jgi:hypothetical protein
VLPWSAYGGTSAGVHDRERQRAAWRVTRRTADRRVRARRVAVPRSTRVARDTAHGPPVAGPPRRARTTAHGEVWCTRECSRARERGRHCGTPKELVVAPFE